MSRTLISAVLGSPGFYILVQRVLGAHTMRRVSIEELAPGPGDTILDVGCGPAYYLPSLPRCEYHGFDTDERYIAYARRHFGAIGHFYAETFTQSRAATMPKFDGVLLMGLLHHLNDDSSHALLDLAAQSLAPGGRVVTLDTVLFDGQSRLSRYLARKDRGTYVRSPEAFLAIAQDHFARVDSRLLGDTLRSPSAHFLMKLSHDTAKFAP